MFVRFDRGIFLDDLAETLENAMQKAPSLVVVPTDREVNTYEMHFKDKYKGVKCISFSKFLERLWVLSDPRPRNIIFFRLDDTLKDLSLGTNIGYVSIQKRGKKEDVKNEA